jgi:hypothetical protein
MEEIRTEQKLKAWPDPAKAFEWLSQQKVSTLQIG